jgi:hypothetical protein
LVIGGIFGKEAGLAALAGGAKGYADVLGNRQKQISADQEALANLTEKDEEMALKRETQEAKGQRGTPTQIIKNPQTGEETSYQKVAPDLWVPQYIMENPVLKESLNKDLNDYKKLRGEVNSLDQDTKQFLEVATQLKESGVPWKIIQNIMTATNPKTIKWVSPEITLNGRQQNSGLALNAALARIKMKIASTEHLGQLDAAAQRVANEIVANPFTSLASVEDAMALIWDLREKEHNSLNQNAARNDFYTGGMADKMRAEDEQLHNLWKGKKNRERSSSEVGEI